VNGDETAPLLRLKFISPGYFEVMGDPVLAGRPFSWADVHDRANAVVVTENFATQYWSNPAEALGKRIRVGQQEGPWREIIGVVRNVHDDGADHPATTVVYLPPIVEGLWGREVYARRIMIYAIRHSGRGEAGLTEEIREAVWSLHPALPVANVQTMKDIYDLSMSRTSFTVLMLAIAAVVALLIGAAGIYGVMSYIVSQRTREIGLRMALGARKHDVIHMVLRRGLVLAGIGVLVGLGVAVVLTRLMSTMLFGISPMDPLTLGLVSIGLAFVALLAGYLPSRRAAQVNPLEALQSE
jgi:predicted permease